MKAKYEDAYGNLTLTCNSCGEESTFNECCDDGELVHFDDCDCSECIGVSE